MKKILSLITLLCLVLSLLAFVSCNKEEPKESETPSSTESKESQITTLNGKTVEQVYNDARSFLGSLTKYECSVYEGQSTVILGEPVTSSVSATIRTDGENAECVYSNGISRTLVDGVMCYVEKDFSQLINISKEEFFATYMGSLAATMLTLKSEAFSGTGFTKKDDLYYLNITMTPEEFASYANGSVNGNVEYEVVFKSDGNVVAIAMYSEYLASGGTVVKTEKMYDFLRLGSSGDIKLPEVECLDMRAIENIDCLTESAVATDYVLLDVKDRGKILIKLFENIAPESVANFKKLVGEGFYDGTVFHRIIEGFMIQGGGFTVDMEYKESQSVKGEFYANGFDNKLSHNRGIVSMARAASYNSGAAQFFIMQAARPSLNGNYAAFGCVIYGMDIVDKIAAVETDNSDKPIENIVINSAKFVTLP